MKKSQTKQALLSVFFGPAGLFYISVNAALFLTLLTLIGVIVFSDAALHVLLASFTGTVVIGYLLVHSHNRLVNSKEFTLSTYVGRVSCKVIGKSRFKRDYSKPLAKAKLKRKVRDTASYALASLCLVLAGLVALPKATDQIDAITQKMADDEKVAEADNENSSQPALADVAPLVAAAHQSTPASEANSQLTNIGIWNVQAHTAGTDFQARLLGNTYKNTSEGYYRPVLILDCDRGQATIRFDAFEVLGTENTQLTLNFDSGPQETFNWKLHSDYRSAYTTASKTLLKKLSRSKQLQVGYRPFGSDLNRSIDFDLGDSSTVTSKLKRRCT